ncbi:MAG: DUF721 domain-containing protein [Salinivirgaceae bacterium]|nr:DUF721 domain-containing protein [Salinivirgaceae bacterium]
MKRQNTTSLGETIQLWIESTKLRGQLNEKRLIAAWKPMVGDYMASLTREIYIKNRTLFVHIDSSVVRNELLLAKPMLIKRLNDENGGDIIDDIVIR